MKQKPTKELKEKKTPQDVELQEYLSDFEASMSYLRNNYHELWKDCYRLYRNKRTKIGYEGYSDAFVPETHTIIESLVANIAGGKPKFRFLPTNDNQEQEVDVINDLMDYVWECNNMGLKSQIWVREMLQYGTGILYVTWDSERNIPAIHNIPVYDFIFDPTATNRENARYLGFRYLANKSDLEKEQILDPETGEYKKKYNMADVKDLSTGDKGEQTDKEVKDILTGSTVPGSAAEKQVEVIVLYYKDGKEVRIGNRSALIYKDDSPYQQAEKEVDAQVMVNEQMVTQKPTIPAIKPFQPFAVLRDYVDPSLFLGMGEIEVIKDRQENLNDVENMDLDNAAYANNIMWQIDPQYQDLMPEITAAPGLVVPIPQGALRPIERPVSTQDFSATKNEMTQQMRRATAADEVIQGVSQDQGRVTATEVSTQLAQSHMRFSTKINNLESEGYAQLASILLKCCQIFISQEQAVRILGEEGVRWKDFDPNEFIGDYEPHVKLDSTVKQMKLEEGQKLNQMYQLIISNPNVNQPAALRFVFKNLGADEEDIQKLLAVEPPKPQAPLPRVNISLKGELPPDQEEMLAQTQGFSSALHPSVPGPNSPLNIPGQSLPEPTTTDMMG